MEYKSTYYIIVSATLSRRRHSLLIVVIITTTPSTTTSTITLYSILWGRVPTLTLTIIVCNLFVLWSLYYNIVVVSFLFQRHI